jgi:hypothetical protein
MPITYTNRKGRTYYLCRGVTKTGKPRYYFAREPKDEFVEQMPEGYQINESVNGTVSLVKIRPARVLPEEVAAVEAGIRQHPKAQNYRFDVKDNQILIYERVEADPAELIPELKRARLVIPGWDERLREMLDRRARFTPVMRFILLNETTRTFCTERWCYLGSIDDWISVGPPGPLEQLARQFIPKLGTDALFERY